MITEAALITASCVLFVQMGLSGAIQERLGFRSKILSCVRCSTFWSVLAYSLVSGNGIIPSVAASFFSSYASLWLSLLYDALAKLYNSLYESITETNDTPEDAPATTDGPETATDEVSQM